MQGPPRCASSICAAPRGMLFVTWHATGASSQTTTTGERTRSHTHTPSPTETDGHPAHARTIRCSANNSAHRQMDQLERIEGGQYIYSDKPNKQPHRHTRKNRHPTRHPIKTIPRAPAHPALGAVKVRRDVCDKERECDPRERDEQGRDEHREEKLPGAAGAPTWSDKHRGSMAFMAQIQTNKQLSRGPLQISNKVRLNRNGSLLRARERAQPHTHTATQSTRRRAAHHTNRAIDPLRQRRALRAAHSGALLAKPEDQGSDGKQSEIEPPERHGCLPPGIT